MPMRTRPVYHDEIDDVEITRHDHIYCIVGMLHIFLYC